MEKFSEFADVRFTVSEFAGGEPFISTLENGSNKNRILDTTTNFLIILNDGTTFEEANRLVNHLNQHAKQISVQRH